MLRRRPWFCPFVLSAVLLLMMLRSGSASSGSSVSMLIAVSPARPPWTRRALLSFRRQGTPIAEWAP
eukprot:7449170-Lingulodinium_polyedra.AAC.1